MDFTDEYTMEDLINEGLSIDGSHHKQWYLEQIAKKLGIKIDESEYEKGIAP